MARKYQQGIYAVENRDKYLGDPNKCTYRSSWERRVFIKLDQSKNVLKWGSECVVIPYVSPKDGKVHRYFPDLLVVAKGKDGMPIATLIEIKPVKQTYAPTSKGKRKTQFVNEVMTYAINQAKWDAAEAYCKKKGWRWYVMTENDIYK